MLLKGKITISELSRLINFSRPTLYKYLDEYEKKCYDNIPSNVVNLFDYIYSDESYNKNDIIEYCASSFMFSSTNSIIDEVKMLIKTKDGFKEKLREFIDDFYKENKEWKKCLTIAKKLII